MASGGRCSRCEQLGHHAKDCKQGPSCFKCGREGHLSWQCSAGITCNSCGKFGHRQSDCPSMACNRCQRPGHMARNCTEVRDISGMPLRGGDRRCHNCNQAGHFASECTNARIPRCEMCGMIGHMWNACPRRPVPPGSNCFNCGDENHLAHMCPKPQATVKLMDSLRAQKLQETTGVTQFAPVSKRADELESQGALLRARVTVRAKPAAVDSCGSRKSKRSAGNSSSEIIDSGSMELAKVRKIFASESKLKSVERADSSSNISALAALVGDYGSSDTCDDDSGGTSDHAE